MSILYISENSSLITRCEEYPLFDLTNAFQPICSCVEQLVNQSLPPLSEVKKLFIRTQQNRDAQALPDESKKMFDTYRLGITHLVKFLNQKVSLDRVLNLLSWKLFKTEELPDQICEKIIEMSPSEPLPPPSETHPTSICSTSYFYQEAITECENLQCWEKGDRPKAFIISGKHDTSAWGGIENEKSPYFYRVLYKIYDFCTISVFSKSDLQEGMKEFVSKKGKIDFLRWNFHGEPKQVTFFRNSHGFFHQADTTDDFGFLKDTVNQNGTIYLSSCSTGHGKEKSPNFANHISNSAPLGVTVVAPVIPSYDFKTQALIENEKIKVMQGDHRLFWEDMTYTIDPANREKHCKESSEHLKFCQSTPP